MARKKREDSQEPLVAQRNSRFCSTICICQLTFILSGVALVYLAVAVYFPSQKAFNYGMEPVPVMCQTINTSLKNNCDWASCGEWCLTKSSGSCPQIQVTARRNGTTIQIQNCSRLGSFFCPMPALAIKNNTYNCNNDTCDAGLKGVFNCSLGICINMSSQFQCNSVADGITVNPRKENTKLNGFFECHKHRCIKFTKPPVFERICSKITTSSMNVYVQFDDNVYVGDCKRAVAFTASNGTEELEMIDPIEIWTEEGAGGSLLTTCHEVMRTNDGGLNATDCINGTVLEEAEFPQPAINFSIFNSLVENSTRILDSTQRFLPMQNSITLINYTRLLINLDGCVNTLRGECNEFVLEYGNDGDNKTAQSRYPCYYHKTKTERVVVRWDLEKTRKEFFYSLVVPLTAFVVSFVTLLLIGQTVRVGDDAIMRCQICPKRSMSNNTVSSHHTDSDLAMDGIFQRTNNMHYDDGGYVNTVA